MVSLSVQGRLGSHRNRCQLKLAISRKDPWSVICFSDAVPLATSWEPGADDQALHFVPAIR